MTHSFRNHDDFVTALQRHEDQAVVKLWNALAPALTRFARKQLDPRILQKEGADDIVNSAFGSFFDWLRNNTEHITDQDSLRRLLFRITFHECQERVKRYRAAKRDVRREQGKSFQETADCAENRRRIGSSASAEAVACAKEILDEVVRRLTEEEQQVLRLHMQGLEIEAIGERLERSERTVYRRLNSIRDALSRAVSDGFAKKEGRDDATES